MSVIEVGGVVAAPGTRAQGWLECARLPDGEPVRVPLIVVNGDAPGPILWLDSLMQADELSSIKVVWEVAKRRIDPARLMGGLIAATILNPLGFRQRTHFTPEDRLDLQFAFPGDARGSVTRRMAYTIFHEAVAQCDAIIDMHCPGYNSLPWAGVVEGAAPEVMEKSIGMVRAFGWPAGGLPRPVLPHSLVACGQDVGKPGIFGEVLWPGVPLAASVEEGVRGILNVMRYLGLIEGEIEPQPDYGVPTGPHGHVICRTEEGGFVDLKVQPGDPVRQGQVVAILRDPFGEAVEEVRSPSNGYARTLSQMVANPGDGVVTLFVTD